MYYTGGYFEYNNFIVSYDIVKEERSGGYSLGENSWRSFHINFELRIRIQPPLLVVPSHLVTERVWCLCDFYFR